MRNCDTSDSPLASHDDFRQELYHDLHEDMSEEQLHERMEQEAERAIAKKFLSMIQGTLAWCRAGKTAMQIYERLEIARWMFGCETSSLSLAKLGKTFVETKTRASMNNSVLDLQAALDLPPTVAQKILESRKAYSEARSAKLTSKKI